MDEVLTTLEMCDDEQVVLTMTIECGRGELLEAAYRVATVAILNCLYVCFSSFVEASSLGHTICGQKRAPQLEQGPWVK